MKEKDAWIVLGKISDSLLGNVMAIQIGGNALVFHRLKSATHDIDLVVSTKEQGPILAAVKSAGFAEFQKFEEPPFIRAKSMSGDIVDLFFDKVGMIAFTQGIKERAKQLPDLANIFVASKEDVFIFKAVTERHEDLDDMVALVQSGLDFQIIERALEEQPARRKIVMQMKMTLKRLKENRNIDIPQLKRILG